MTPSNKTDSALSIESAVPLQPYELPREEDFKNNLKRATVVNTIHEEIPPYFISEELAKSVDYARLLKRPLLLRGEPGTGKARLA